MWCSESPTVNERDRRMRYRAILSGLVCGPTGAVSRARIVQFGVSSASPRGRPRSAAATLYGLLGCASQQSPSREVSPSGLFTNRVVSSRQAQLARRHCFQHVQAGCELADHLGGQVPARFGVFGFGGDITPGEGDMSGGPAAGPPGAVGRREMVRDHSLRRRATGRRRRR
jgi:hypothetical protein